MRSIFILATLAILCLIAGCGGSSSSSTDGDRITEGNEANFSEDALRLTEAAANDNGDIGLSAASARSIDADLVAIRSLYPQVKNVHIRESNDLHTLWVAVNPQSSWVNNWSDSNIVTGDSKLDTLLTRFPTRSVSRLDYFDGVDVGIPFVIRFTDLVNLKQLARQIQAANPEIRAARPDVIVNNQVGSITLLPSDSAGNRDYTIDEGIASCAPDCTTHHVWEFTVSPRNRAVTLVKESTVPTQQVNPGSATAQ